MGNRSRYLAATAATGVAVLAARRRARLRRAVQDAAATFGGPEPQAAAPPVVADDAHAPGHRHLFRRQPHGNGKGRSRQRPWTRHGYTPYAPD